MNESMTQQLQDRVRLTRAVPTLWLQCGDIGVIRSVWRGSSPRYYEVEFPPRAGEWFAVRALIRADHLEVLQPSRPVSCN